MGVLDYLSFEIRLSTVWCGVVLYGTTLRGSICYGAMSCGFVWCGVKREAGRGEKEN